MQTKTEPKRAIEGQNTPNQCQGRTLKIPPPVEVGKKEVSSVSEACLLRACFCSCSLFWGGEGRRFGRIWADLGGFGRKEAVP